jgi:hypothetical protein
MGTEADPVRAEMIRIIQLTQKFEMDPPSVTSILPGSPGSGTRLKTAIILSGVLLLFLGGYMLLAISNGPEGRDRTLMFSGLSLILAGVFGTFYLSSKFLKVRSEKSAKERKRLE